MLGKLRISLPFFAGYILVWLDHLSFPRQEGLWMQGIKAHGKMPSVTFSLLLFLTSGSFILSSIKCVYDIQSCTDFNYSIIMLTRTSNNKKNFTKMTSIIFLMHKIDVSNWGKCIRSDINLGIWILRPSNRSQTEKVIYINHWGVSWKAVNLSSLKEVLRYKVTQMKPLKYRMEGFIAIIYYKF